MQVRVRRCFFILLFRVSPRRKHLHSAAKAFSKLFKCFYISCKFYRILEILIPVLFHSNMLQMSTFGVIRLYTKLLSIET